MKIIVCIKRVPDTTTRVRIGADGRSIDPNVEYVINPYDEHAIEEGVRIKEKFGGDVTLVSLGPDGAKDTLRKALALGADNAIHLKADISGIHDSLSVAKALAECIKSLEHDIILFGKQAIDNDDLLVGPMVAQFLGLPSVSVVVKMDISEKKVVCRREIEGALEIVETHIPCVITTQKGLNEPRYASLKGIMEAKKKPIEERVVSMSPSKIEITRMELPPERIGGKFIGKGKADVHRIIELLKSEAKVL